MVYEFKMLNHCIAPSLVIYFYVGSRVGKETFRFYTEDKQQTYDDKMCTERTAEISATTKEGFRSTTLSCLE